MEGWAEIMYNQMTTTNRYIWIINFIMVFIGNFFIINLVLAVVAINFLQVHSMVIFVYRILLKPNPMLYGA